MSFAPCKAKQGLRMKEFTRKSAEFELQDDVCIEIRQPEILSLTFI